MSGVKILIAVVRRYDDNGHFKETFKETRWKMMEIRRFDIDIDAGQPSRRFPQIGQFAGNPADVDLSYSHQLKLSGKCQAKI
jgi:hypothetical protein